MWNAACDETRGQTRKPKRHTLKGHTQASLPNVTKRNARLYKPASFTKRRVTSRVPSRVTKPTKRSAKCAMCVAGRLSQKQTVAHER